MIGPLELGDVQQPELEPVLWQLVGEGVDRPNDNVPALRIRVKPGAEFSRHGHGIDKQGLVI
jgi:hypothetical protein